MFNGHPVLDRQTLYEQGCFRKERLWLPGWQDIRGQNLTIRYIWGFTGKETEITRDLITPIGIIEVKLRKVA